MDSFATNRVRFAGSSIVHSAVIRGPLVNARATGAGISWIVRWFGLPRTSPPLLRASDADFYESKGSSKAVDPYLHPILLVAGSRAQRRICRTSGNLNRTCRGLFPAR